MHQARLRGAKQGRRVSDAEYRRRSDVERAHTVAMHARGTDVGTTRLDDPRLWAQVYDDGAHRTRWWRSMGWLEYRYGAVRLQVINPDGTWRPWSAAALAATTAACGGAALLGVPFRERHPTPRDAKALGQGRRLRLVLRSALVVAAVMALVLGRRARTVEAPG
jgi:hypothetical protein